MAEVWIQPGWGLHLMSVDYTTLIKRVIFLMQQAETGSAA